MTVIIDYGVGNLYSLKCSLKAVGEDAVVSSDPDIILSADRVILPGVGAFADAAHALTKTGLYKAVEKCALLGIPTIGICLGMQLLFDTSYEMGKHRGLGLIPGEVVPIEPGKERLPVPHVGYNKLIMKNPSPIYREKGERYMYFVHSYHVKTQDEYITSTVEYGQMLTASVQKGSLYGCQFHPEKSGDTGLMLLKDFCTLHR